MNYVCDTIFLINQLNCWLDSLTNLIASVRSFRNIDADAVPYVLHWLAVADGQNNYGIPFRIHRGQR